MDTTRSTEDIDTSTPEYRQAWLRAVEWSTCKLTRRARELAERKARGLGGEAEAIELRAIAAVYRLRRATLACITVERLEDPSAPALAGHLDRLAALVESMHPTASATTGCGGRRSGWPRRSGTSCGPATAPPPPDRRSPAPAPGATPLSHPGGGDRAGPYPFAGSGR